MFQPYAGYTPHPGEEPAGGTHTINNEREEAAKASGDEEFTDELLELFGHKDSVPLEVGRLPWILQEYLALTTKCTDARPGLLLTAFLPFCAVNLGNRICMVNNSVPIFPNIWSCLLGPSSFSRKTTALRFADYTIRPYEDPLLSGPVEEFERDTMRLDSVTLAKLYSMLALNSSRLFVHHELASALQEMNKSYNQSYKQSLTQLFDGESRSQMNMDRMERIINPALSIAAATTEGWLYQNVQNGPDLLSGFLQRFLFYVVRGVNLEEIDLRIRENADLPKKLAWFDRNVFTPWRGIPAGTRLELAPEAIEYRNREYERRYHYYFRRNNDVLMSYFTRLYDAYWFKFCIIGALSGISAQMPEYWRNGRLPLLLRDLKVSEEDARQAMYMCDFYMRNVRPLLSIMDEQDKLAGERKLVDLIINKYGGRAAHTQLMNAAHMKKREFSELVENLIERGAISVQTQKSNNHLSAKVYVIAREILDSHRQGR